MRCRAAECSAPHGGETSRWDSQVNRGGGSESVGGRGNMEEVRRVGRGEAVNGLKC